MTTTWLDLPPGTGFGPDNLPYGVFSTGSDGPRRVGVAVGDHVLDASRLDVPAADSLATGSLNALLARGRDTWDALRARLQELLRDPAHRSAVEPHLLPRDEVTLHLPVEVADYVDFYSSEHHAENLGRMFRPDSPPLTPNWKHLPIGYHGRAGTVHVSVTPVIRPNGQRKAPAEDAPTFGPSQRLDIEAEIGFVVGTPSAVTLTATAPGIAADRISLAFGLMCWTPAQQMAPMTVNGACLRTGDLFASGTVSGPAKDQRGSFIELSWGGQGPLTLPGGSTRTFLEDGDVRQTPNTCSANASIDTGQPSGAGPPHRGAAQRRAGQLPAWRGHRPRRALPRPQRRTTMTSPTVSEPVSLPPSSRVSRFTVSVELLMMGKTVVAKLMFTGSTATGQATGRSSGWRASRRSLCRG